MTRQNSRPHELRDLLETFKEDLVPPKEDWQAFKVLIRASLRTGNKVFKSSIMQMPEEDMMVTLFAMGRAYQQLLWLGQLGNKGVGETQGI